MMSATPRSGAISAAPAMGAISTRLPRPSKYLRVRFGKEVATTSPSGRASGPLTAMVSGTATDNRQCPKLSL